MAYADPLDETAPAGNTKAKLGDDAIRTHIRAIRQRLSSIFVDIDADPLVLKPGVINSGMLIDLLVSTAKLADLSVTTGKLADRAVTAIKLGLGAVLPEHIGAGNFAFPGDISANAGQINAQLGFTQGGGAALGKFLRGDGARFVSGDIQVTDIPDALLQKLLISVDGFFVRNIPFASSSFMTRFFSGIGAQDQHVWIAPYAGEVRAVWCRADSDRTAGNAAFCVSFNFSGGVDNGCKAQLTGDGPIANRQDYRLYGPGVYPFAAGDQLGMFWQSIGFSPNDNTVVAGFLVRFT